MVKQLELFLECVEIKKSLGSSWVPDLISNKEFYVGISVDGKSQTKTLYKPKHKNTVTFREEFILTFEEDTNPQVVGFELARDDVLLNMTSLGHAELKIDDIWSKLKGHVQVELLDVKHTVFAVLSLFFSCSTFPKKAHFYKLMHGFPMRPHSRITLYQDAHVGENTLPALCQDNNTFITPPADNCWEEIYLAIKNAKKLIYMTGWSLNTLTRLIRVKTNRVAETDVKIGELLKEKASQGVRVCILIWNDATSVTSMAEGVMNTHDEQTKVFFNSSKVYCSLAYRKSDTIVNTALSTVTGTVTSALGVLTSPLALVTGNTHVEESKPKSLVQSRSTVSNKKANQAESTAFKSLTSDYVWTHHQKTVIVDADPLPGLDNKRRLIAFVGGLDITDGRWDTPKHSLFRTIHSLHIDDFYQNCVLVTPRYGPREPWHDIHAKVEGRIAHDILTNFEQRWKTKPKRLAQLVNLEEAGIVKCYEDEVDLSDESWSCSMFRSIDKFSAILDEHINVERTIQEAYIRAIQGAERFIYIESQYFIGSSQHWGEFSDVGAANLIPYEIAARIVEKIKNGQPFTAYILIPMFSEGIPSSEPIQQILFWQWNTISMMYRMISRALVEQRILDKTVYDYLCFFCLGNREVCDEFSPPEAPPPALPKPIPDAGFNTFLLHKTRRHQIYVHSKMMVVDDEYIIVGSANINERSMAGHRDTEICVGGFQPKHIGEKPRGAVHRFRMSLWAEHMNCSLPEFLDPSSLACVRKVRELAQKNFLQYISVEVTEMSAHLMSYPIHFDPAAEACYPNPICFPDTTALICGRVSTTIPNVITV